MLFFLALFCVSYIGALSTIPIHEISFPADFSQTKSCILCDLDGTLLNSEHTVSEENIVTIQEAMKNGWRFIPATGRTRVSMRNAVGEDVIQRLFGDGSRMPGIYQQGLMVFGLNGELIYERLLEQEVIEMAVSFCKEENLSLIAYAGDRVFCERRTLETDKVVAYKDPEPETFSQGLHKLHTEGIHVHKLIVVADPLKIPSIRSKMVPFLANKATFTQVNFIEFMPR